MIGRPEYTLTLPPPVQPTGTTSFRFRKATREGKDPYAVRRKDSPIPTFAEAAAAVIELNRPTWSNPKHGAQWESTLLAVLAEASEFRTGEDSLIFPSQRGMPLSDSTISKLCRENGTNAVPHGFRSSFRDWASEKTNAPHAVMEAALAHTISNQVEAAYHRTDLFDRRRKLMDSWSSYLTATPAKVVKIR